MDKVELLFFDTFANNNSQGVNLDLVKFVKPVHISEVRVIPLGSRVNANFPGGGVRLGATNPSQFSVEFFVNNVSNPTADSFEEFGKFEYNPYRCINLKAINTDIPSDGLILKGWYDTITLAVYGWPAKLESHTSYLVHKPPSPSSIDKSPSDHEAATAEWVQQHAQVISARAG